MSAMGMDLASVSIMFRSDFWTVRTVDNVIICVFHFIVELDKNEKLKVVKFNKVHHPNVI